MSGFESSTPVAVLRSQENSPILGRITAISTGATHACALTTGGNVKCWGDGHSGQLGNGRRVRVDYYYYSNFVPVDVHTNTTNPNPLSDIMAISSGGYHTCALTTGGNVKCWGAGHSGQLGYGESGDYSSQSTPVDVHTSSSDPIPLSGISAISAGSNHTCALTTGGNIKCWGSRGYGQLGGGSYIGSNYQSTPVDVYTSSTDSSPFSSISAGGRHTCALTVGGNVKCWGARRYGQLGNGTDSGVDVHTSSTDSNPLSGIMAISAGDSHTCALTVDGNVKCWGNGGSGQLGDGGYGYGIIQLSNTLLPTNSS